MTETVAWFREQAERITTSVSAAVLGKPRAVRLALTCLCAEGHLLLEDLPGTGKTLLARSVAASVSGSHARIQFTPDLLPADVTGVTVYDQHRGSFDFRPGPIFHDIVLADEINRASPKTQSALLEVMEEGRVTVDGVTHEVPRPFLVIATQNPVELAGTYPLPEAQLDRFLVCTSVGHPDAEATEEMLLGASVRDRASLVTAVVDTETVGAMVRTAADVHLDGAIARYVRRLAEASRIRDEVRLGVSARGALALVRAAKAWAATEGRDAVVPEDVTALAPDVLSHRILLHPAAEVSGHDSRALVDELLETVAPPTGRLDGVRP